MPARAQVLVVLSDGSTSDQAVAEELRADMMSQAAESTRVDTLMASHLAKIDQATFDAYQLVVTVGLTAAQAATSRDSGVSTSRPTLCLLIPRQSFEQLPSVRNNARERRVSAVFIDQPLARQLDLLRLALPDRHRVGVVLGPSSQLLGDELHALARERSLILNLAKVGESSGVYAALQTVIAESNLILLLPDPVATNADTVYGLLLASYRAQVPVAGFSEGLLNAGALVSLYSTARQQGRQGAEIANRILRREGSFPVPQYPKYFTVRVNTSVAYSLGLHLPAEATLSGALNDKREGPDAVPPHAGNDAATRRSEP